MLDIKKVRLCYLTYANVMVYLYDLFKGIKKGPSILFKYKGD